MIIPLNPARLKITKRVWWSNCIISFGVKLIGVFLVEEQQLSSKLFQSADTSEQWRKRGASVTVQSSIIPSLSLSIWTQAQRNVSKTPWKVLEGEQPFKRPLFLSWNKCTSHSFKFDLTTRLHPSSRIPDPEEMGETRSFHTSSPLSPKFTAVTRGYLFAN